MTSEKRTLSKIIIEIDVATKPVLRNWTTSAATPKELEPFLIGIHVEHCSPRNGVNTVVELTGPAYALNNFLNNVLSDEVQQAIELCWNMC